MKKNICLFLCILMLLLAACAPQQPDAPATTTAAPTTEATTTAPQVGGIKNIILIIGDGMGPAQLQSGQLSSGKTYAFTSWDNTYVNTNCLDSKGEPTVTTDSAAAATALATGQRTTITRVGQDKDGTNLKTILDYAGEDYGKATGIVTTDTLHGATPAGFSSHAETRYDEKGILNAQLVSNINLLCGSSSDYTFNMRTSIGYAGYTLCDSLSYAETKLDADKLYWQMSMGGDSPLVDLDETVLCALDYLSQDSDGFVMMVEQAHVDKYCHSNEFYGMQACVNYLNDTVEAIMGWIGDRTDTAVLITADHETGGLSVSTEDIYPNMFTADSGQNIYYQWTSTGHTPTEVHLFSYGFEPHFERYYTEQSPAAIKNTDVFNIMLDLLENPQQ